MRVNRGNTVIILEGEKGNGSTLVKQRFRIQGATTLAYRKSQNLDTKNVLNR